MSTLSTDSQLATQPASTSEPTNLQLTDLQNLLMIVDVASQRGAFKGPELSQVGSVFDRVAKFLESTLPKPDEGSTPTPTPPVVSEMKSPFFAEGVKI
jgi:hypothetical protein